MISDITLGQFFPGKSSLHRLDPRTKIIITVAAIVGIFMANTAAGLVLMTLAAAALIGVSRISFKVIFKGIKPIIFILIFTAILNVFMTKGESEPLVSFGIITIYQPMRNHTSLFQKTCMTHHFTKCQREHSEFTLTTSQ